MAKRKTKIFISYRRQDNPEFVERIRDWFIIHYGRDNVFIDFDTIPPFVKFDDFIREKVEESDVVVAIIGPDWLKLLKEKATNFEEDYVRIEIALALKLGKLVAPICIKGAQVPRPADLPDELRAMLAYNAAFLNSGREFLDNIKRIVSAVEVELKNRRNALLPTKPSGMSAGKYVLQANRRRRNGDLDGALTDYEEALRIDPEYARAYTGRGNVRWNQGDLEGALADYEEALRLNPKSASAYTGRGNVRYRQGALEGALTDYEKALHIDPEYASAYLGRGYVRSAQGDLERALTDYEKALHIDPEYASAYTGRGYVRCRQGDLEGALTDYEEALRIDPKYPLPYLKRGDIYRMKNELEKAIGDYQRYLNLGGGKRYGDREEVEQLIRDLKTRLDKQQS